MKRSTIIGYLRSDHARLHGLLERAMALPHLDQEAFAAFRRGLLRHIAIEEKMLLPAVRKARGGQIIERAHELRIDHAALTSLLVPTPDLELCREILSLVSTHDAKEEGADGVYEECERWLDHDDLVDLAEQAALFPEVRVARHFDGANVHRTAEGALASARRMRAPKKNNHVCWTSYGRTVVAEEVIVFEGVEDLGEPSRRWPRSGFPPSPRRRLPTRHALRLRR